VKDSVRRTEVKRKTEREQHKERKKLEKEKKVSEIQRFKALKRKEILDKLEKLQEISGKSNLEFSEADVEGDFDPLEYDRRMEQIFSEQYYDGVNDDEKPVFPYDDDIDAEMEGMNNGHILVCIRSGLGLLDMHLYSNCNYYIQISKNGYLTRRIVKMKKHRPPISRRKRRRKRKRAKFKMRLKNPIRIAM
jgi:prolyl oligopeptidase PreP (S9A serine peptidase family)